MESTTRGCCPYCGSGSGGKFVNGVFAYCFACHTVGETQQEALQERIEADQASLLKAQEPDISHLLNLEWSVEAEVWLAKCGLTAIIAADHGISMYDATSKAPRVAVPLRDVNGVYGHSLRALESWQKPKWLHTVKETPYTVPVTHKGGPLILTEDPMSALAIGRAGFDAMALLGTTLKQKAAKVIRGRRVFAWLDNDQAGLDGTIKLRQTLPDIGVILQDKEPKVLQQSRLKEVLEKRCE